MLLCHVVGSVECVVYNLLGIHNICIQVCSMHKNVDVRVWWFKSIYVYG